MVPCSTDTPHSNKQFQSADSANGKITVSLKARLCDLGIEYNKDTTTIYVVICNNTPKVVVLSANSSVRNIFQT